MGDRVSISFRNKTAGYIQESVVLFSHWGGMDFVEEAQKYVAELPPLGIGRPLDRREPETVMVDFIRHITKDLYRVDSDLYICATLNDGDNSDNGHHIIDLVPVEQVTDGLRS